MAIKIKTIPKFPSNVLGGVGIVVRKTNGQYTFDLNFEELQIAALGPAQNDYLACWDEATNQFFRIKVSDFISLLPVVGEAPNDGNYYARRNLGWSAIGTLPYVPLPSGRLSFSSTTGKSIADISGAGAATLWYVDVGGGAIPIWSAALNSFVMRTFSGALQLPLDPDPAHFAYAAANNAFDVYAYYDSVLGQPRLGITNTAGLDFSQRGGLINSLTQKSGIWVAGLNGFLRINNTGNVAGVDYIQPGQFQATYLGSIGTVAAGQGEDSKLKRLIFNAYNPTDRIAWKKSTVAPYNYIGGGRIVNADATNRLLICNGLPGMKIRIKASHWTTNDTANAIFNTTVFDTQAGVIIPETEDTASGLGRAITVAPHGYQCSFEAIIEPSIGVKDYQWWEVGPGAGVCNWQQNSAVLRNGISAEMMM